MKYYIEYRPCYNPPTNKGFIHYDFNRRFYISFTSIKYYYNLNTIIFLSQYCERWEKYFNSKYLKFHTYIKEN